MFYKLMRGMNVNIIYDHADYRLISRKVIKSLRDFREVNLFLRGIFPYMGFKNSIVEYERAERVAGETKYPLGKMINFAMEGITSSSQYPLRMVYVAGGITFLIALIVSIWVLVQWINHRTIQGWASTLLVMSVFSGMQILFLALIGEYVGKIYMETKQRPPFIIEETFTAENLADEQDE